MTPESPKEERAGMDEWPRCYKCNAPVDEVIVVGPSLYTMHHYFKFTHHGSTQTIKVRADTIQTLPRIGRGFHTVFLKEGDYEF